MSPAIRLETHVQRKLARGREFFYFRVAKRGQPEFRRPLPHPFSRDYRAAYDAAWAEYYGVHPGHFRDPQSWDALTRQHRDSAKYQALSSNSRRLRDMAIDLAIDRWGAFAPSQIRPIHVQAVYDSLAARPATANRRLDDLSALFSWGSVRGFCDANPCTKIERIKSAGTYEPWPQWALEKLLGHGRPHLTRVVLGAIYTGQRRDELLTRFTASRIRDGVWSPRQGKTGTIVPVPLHPILLAIVEDHSQLMKQRGRIDRDAPIFENSRGQPWTGNGFSASWQREMVRLGLHREEPRLVFHGFRATQATIIADAVAKSPDLFGSIERVQAMLGHLSPRMAEHYARRAQTEVWNAESILLMPHFGADVGKHL